MIIKDLIKVCQQGPELVLEFYSTLSAVKFFDKIGDDTGDTAIAIAEHAFRAGWDAAYEACKEGIGDCNVAWSEYDPSEHIKALS